MGAVETMRLKELLVEVDEAIDAAKNEAASLGALHTQLAEAEYAITRAGWQIASACRHVVAYHVAAEEA